MDRYSRVVTGGWLQMREQGSGYSQLQPNRTISASQRFCSRGTIAFFIGCREIRVIKLILILGAIALLFYGFKRLSNNPQIAVDNIQKGEVFLTANATAEDVKTTPSGLQYKVLEPGNGSEHPGPTDRVKVHYHGTLIDGSVFDSSVKRGEPIDFGLNQVIAGWTEGLQTMVVGEKTRLFIPSSLAYGNSSAGSIPAGSVLIFDVELIAINP
tara:strand:+ start:3454 stop:4089 length:636 start_codon:yes stop_codon:yes gene_type:complete